MTTAMARSLRSLVSVSVSASMPPPGVARLVLWCDAARSPIYLFTLGLVLVVREQGGSFAQAGAVAACYTVGVAAAGPTIARQAGVRGRRIVLMVTGLIFSSATVGLVVLPPDYVSSRYVLALIIGASLPPANAVMRALWTRIGLDDKGLRRAYLWEALLTETLVVASPALLSLLLLTGSAKTAMIVMATVGGLGTWGLALAKGPDTRDLAAQHAGRVPGSAGRPLHDHRFLALLIVMSVSAVPLGATSVAIPAFFDSSGSLARTGAVYACWGIGSALGVLIFGRLLQGGTDRLFPWFVLAFAIGSSLPIAAASPLGLAFALAIGGLPIALVSASEMSIVSRIADSVSLTEAFTWASTATIVGEAVGLQVGGLLVDGLGPRGVFVVASIVAFFAAALGFFFRDTLTSGPPAVTVPVEGTTP